MGGSPPSRNGNEASDRVFPVGGGGWEHLVLPWQPRQRKLRGWSQGQEPEPFGKGVHHLWGCLARSEAGRELKTQGKKFKGQHTDILLLQFKHVGEGGVQKAMG